MTERVATTTWRLFERAFFAICVVIVAGAVWHSLR